MQYNGWYLCLCDDRTIYYYFQWKGNGNDIFGYNSVLIKGNIRMGEGTKPKVGGGRLVSVIILL